MSVRLCRPRRPPRRTAVRWFLRLAVIASVAGGLVVADAAYVWAVADVPTVIKNLRSWIVGLLAGLATLFLTFGGLRYLMAGGNPGKVEAAKRALKAAAIGYGLAVLAPVLVTVLRAAPASRGNRPNFPMPPVR